MYDIRIQLYRTGTAVRVLDLVPTCFNVATCTSSSELYRYSNCTGTGVPVPAVLVLQLYSCTCTRSINNRSRNQPQLRDIIRVGSLLVQLYCMREVWGCGVQTRTEATDGTTTRILLAHRTRDLVASSRSSTAVVLFEY